MNKYTVIAIAAVMIITALSCSLSGGGQDPRNTEVVGILQCQETIDAVTAEYQAYFNGNPAGMASLTELFTGTKAGSGSRAVPLENIEKNVFKGNNRLKSTENQSVTGRLVLYNHIASAGPDSAGCRTFFIAGDFITPESLVRSVKGYSLDGRSVLVYGNEKIEMIEFTDTGERLAGELLEQVTIFVVAVNEKTGTEQEYPDIAGDPSRSLGDGTYISLKSEYMVDDMEPWFKGSPEVFCIVLANNGVLSCKNLVWFDKIKTYYYETMPICKWTRQILGDYLTFLWIEDDVDIYVKTLSISGSTDNNGNLIVFPSIELDCYPPDISGGFTEADDILGSVAVKYSDPDNSTYTANNNVLFALGH